MKEPIEIIQNNRQHTEKEFYVFFFILFFSLIVFTFKLSAFTFSIYGVLSAKFSRNKANLTTKALMHDYNVSTTLKLQVTMVTARLTCTLPGYHPSDDND